MRFKAFAPLLLVVLLVAGSGLSAKTRPGGWHKDYRNGYQVLVPAKWDRVPPQAGEMVEVGKWYGRAKDWDTFQPRMTVIRIDTRESATTPEIELPEGIEIPDELRDALAAGAPKSVKEWLEADLRRYRGETSLDDEADLRIGKEKGKLYFASVSQGERARLSIMVAAVRRGDVEFGIVFQCDGKDFEKGHKSGFLACARSFRFLDVKSDRDVDYEAAFDAEKLDWDEAELEKRLETIKDIDNVKEWGYLTTKNYLVLYDREVKPKEVKRIAVHIEAIRRDVYEKLFPPDRPIKAISVVRVCKDREQYMAYGGPGGSAGYWSAGAEELVFYGKDQDSIRVLYHEAFHQYIYYAFGEIAPHTWYNEGHGDYFAGFDYRGRFVPGRFAWRRGVIKNAIATGEYVPLAEFLRYTQRQYYARADLCYAEGWSLVYFLRHTRDKRYREILPKYFDALKRNLTGGEEGAQGAAGAALESALDEAFEGIDLARLEEDWKKFKY